MTTDSLDHLWASPANRPTPAESAALVARFQLQLRRRRRLDLGLIVWAAVMLGGPTAWFAWNLLTRPEQPLAAEWGAWLLLALPWIATGALVRKYRATRHPQPSTAPLTAHLHALRAANEGEQRKLRLIAGLLVAMVPISALCVTQLRATGKVAPHEVGSLATVLAAALFAGAGSVAYAYFRHARPAGRRIAEWLRTCE